jgi:hypothetical protein
MERDDEREEQQGEGGRDLNSIASLHTGFKLCEMTLVLSLSPRRISERMSESRFEEGGGWGFTSLGSADTTRYGSDPPPKSCESISAKSNPWVSEWVSEGGSEIDVEGRETFMSLRRYEVLVVYLGKASVTNCGE